LSDWHVRLRPSRTLATVVAIGYVAALTGVWSTLPAAGAALTTLGLAVSAVAVARRLRAHPRALELRGDGGMECIDRNGAVHACRVLDTSVATWWLVTLTLDTGHGDPTAIALFPDSSDRESLRRLRAWLVLHGRGAASPPGRRPLPVSESAQSLTRR
jgi:hypothetical protein